MTQARKQSMEDTKYLVQHHSNAAIIALEQFLACTDFEIEKGNDAANVIDQNSRRVYCFPEDVLPTLLDHLEQCRKREVILGFSEKQYVPDQITHSGIDLDFDIYQRESTRKIKPEHYSCMVRNLIEIILPTLDRNQSDEVFYAAVLRKPDVARVEAEPYIGAFKESFRIRFPGICVTREHKHYLVDRIIDSGLIEKILKNAITLAEGCVWPKVLDRCSASYPVMFLGSAKRGSRTAHEFHKLYRITSSETFGLTIESTTEFDPLPPVSVPQAMGRNKKIIPAPPPTASFRYNLCAELSVTVGAGDDALIPKIDYDPRPDLPLVAGNKIEEAINPNHFDNIDNRLEELTFNDAEARYLVQLMDIISPERARDYNSWRDAIQRLAWTSDKYKPLAVYFSQRCESAWRRGGQQKLDEIWDWSINHQRNGNYIDGPILVLLNCWAKEDSPTAFRALSQSRASSMILHFAHIRAGKLSDHDIAIIAKAMFGDRYICDLDPHSPRPIYQWFEFVLPGDQFGGDKTGIYKWRATRSATPPENLDRYLAEKFPNILNQSLRNLSAEQKVQQPETEGAANFYKSIQRGLQALATNIGNNRTLKPILERCCRVFSRRGFMNQLNTSRECIGVRNGVLVLRPQLELIQRYHDIPISRSIAVGYEPYNPNNPTISHLETELRRLFGGQLDAYEKVMCYLASSLDAMRKTPLFFIWLGEGSNGKTFLLEMMIHTLGLVPDNGYGCKLNVSFFTEQRRNPGGPDSELMMLESARFGYCSESERGERLHMAKIKEATSETIGGNEKYKTQKNFEPNCNFTFCSNNDPEIRGDSSYGTWRRIIVYWFKMKFMANPDPNNPYEYQINRCFEEYPRNPVMCQAFFSILTHYYEILRDKYEYDIHKIPSPAIDADTQTYRESQDTIARFVRLHLCRSDKPVATIPISDIAQRYSNWYYARIDRRVPSAGENEKNIGHYFRKYLVEVDGEIHLRDHILQDPAAVVIPQGADSEEF